MKKVYAINYGINKIYAAPSLYEHYGPFFLNLEDATKHKKYLEDKYTTYHPKFDEAVSLITVWITEILICID